MALLPVSYGAPALAAASALLYTGVSLLGFNQWLPEVPGQTMLPWELSQRELSFQMVLNLSGFGAVGALGASLSTRSRQTGERLARQQAYAGALAHLHEDTIRCMSSGLLTVDLAWRVTSINQAARDILGLPTNEGPGAPVARWIPGLPPLFQNLDLVARVQREELETVRPDGENRFLGVSAAPLSDQHDRIVGRVIHFQDLTELRKVQRAFNRAERLASVGRLAAAIAHEIRNPLAGISGSVEVLKFLPNADADTGRLVDIAVREVDRLNVLITELLDYARPLQEKARTLDLSEIANEVLDAFSAEGREALIVKRQLCPKLHVHAGNGAVRQILWNLIRNAAEAMPEGGTLTVRAVPVEGRRGRKEACLSVHDSGVGIPAETLETIFEPFFPPRPKEQAWVCPRWRGWQRKTTAPSMSAANPGKAPRFRFSSLNRKTASKTVLTKKT